MTNKDQNDDQRMITIPVAALRTYETAVQAHQDARLLVARAKDAWELAKTNLEQAIAEENDTRDARDAAVAGLRLRGNDQ